ncbi:MAG: methylmalonyl-CoA mutase family protein, partial [Pseudomonadota bacterium]
MRFVTAASLFDGHDASINIMRRMLQASGVEVIHLGHNRSVAEIVTAAIHEDVQGIAISSYQGGHVEYFKYMVDMLRERDSGHIQVFGGGGGVIVANEIAELQQHGVARIYSPQDGQTMGLQGMIDDMVERCMFDPARHASESLTGLADNHYRRLSSILTALENGSYSHTAREALLAKATAASRVPVLGITGTGGSGKSSLTDEVIRRFRLDHNDQLSIAILAIDPTRRKTGGALLGDRIRMNAIDHGKIFMRSIATRDAGTDVPPQLTDMLAATQLAGFDLIIVETPGIGQGDAGIVPFCDVSMYVMTPEFGAASQLEKIDMLDFADVIAINKFDRKGAADALRDVSKQVQRNREVFDQPPEVMPVFGTMAARFNDDGVTAVYQSLKALLNDNGAVITGGELALVSTRHSTDDSVLLPANRLRYLAEIAEGVRNYHHNASLQAQAARQIQHLESAQRLMNEASVTVDNDSLQKLTDSKKQSLNPATAALLEQWPQIAERYEGEEFSVTVRDKTLTTSLQHKTLSGSVIRKVSLPRFSDRGDLLYWLMRENLPGYFPYTAGVFPFKREGEDPTRMFAGEGDPFRTNRRFKALSEHASAKRLSTAFDSVTLYGNDPDERPDIYGKVGNSGVSIATVEDMQALYDGFDLCNPTTSVSMTINGPAPTILAFYFNTAIDQQVEKQEKELGRSLTSKEREEIKADTLKKV